jgi:benzodiazapine receptor
VKVTRKDAPAEIDALVPVLSEARAERRKLELPAWTWTFLCIALPLVLGTVLELLTANAATGLLGRLKHPPLFPPLAVIKAAWLGHYVLMGIASSLVLKSGCAPMQLRRALIVYGVQMFIGAAWTIIFFLFELFGIAVALSLLFMAAIAITMDLFTRCSVTSGKLLVPCLLWSSFLSYFTIGIALLN